MKISHIIPSIDTSTGGPARSVTHLISALLKDEDIKISLHCKKSADPILSQFDQKNRVIHFHKNGYLGGLKGLEDDIKEQKPDILHGHGLWQMPVHQMCRIARRQNIPYVITPRGMLEPWALQAGALKKKMALAVYQRNDLQQAEVIHATAEMELKQLRHLGFTNPIALIPNGIDLSDIPNREKFEQKKKKTVLFLSRIHPKKGIEMLIEAWGKLEKPLRKEWRVDIAGNGDKNYIESLQQLIKKSGLDSGIRIIGPQFGQDKTDCYQQAGLFVLSTYSENFGIVVAEALSYGIPVITTQGAPWQDLEIHLAGWWVEIGVQPLKLALEKALSLPAAEREAMGKRGRALVEEKYSIESVAGKMRELYEWMLSYKNKPEFVKLR